MGYPVPVSMGLICPTVPQAALGCASCWGNRRGKTATVLPANPPMKPRLPFLSFPLRASTLLHPHSSSPFVWLSRSSPMAPALLSLGCFSELIILSSLHPLKNPVNYKARCCSSYLEWWIMEVVF